MSATADMGLIGLAVMGENLVLNMESHGYTVAVYNRTAARVDQFLAGRAKGKRILGGHSVKMVHNGIEYGDIQLIGESYHLLGGLLGLGAGALHDVFARWNTGPLD